VINIGDKVWLLRCNLKTNRPCDNLDFRRLGSFSVVKKINDVAFNLELPPSMKIHPVFHVFLLKPYKESSIPGRSQVLLLPIKIERQDELEVSKILNSIIIRRKLEYLIQWQGTTLVKGPGNQSRVVTATDGQTRPSVRPSRPIRLVSVT
jgi:hypothetical protein